MLFRILKKGGLVHLKTDAPDLFDYSLDVLEADEQVDFAYELEGIARFRANVFRHLNGVGGIFRSIPNDVVPSVSWW